MKKILFIILLLSTKCFATQYYVSTAGNNANAGTSSGAAWLTWAYAVAHTTSGDVINVAAGTYTETVQIVVPVGVSIVGADTTVIFKSTVNTAFTPVITLTSGTEGTNGNQSISYIKFDGQSTNDYGLAVLARKNVAVHHCVFINYYSNGVNFSGITSLTGSTAPSTYATGNTFYNNRVYNCSRNDSIYGRGCMQFGGQDGMLVYNNDIQQPYRTGTFTGNIGWPIKMANEGHIKGCSVYNNILKRALFTNGSGHGNNNDWNFSFEMWNIEGLQMYNNTIQGEVDIVHTSKTTYGYGLRFINNTISYPAITAYYNSGIRLETNEANVTIDSNHFINTMPCILFSPHDYGNPGDSTNFGLYVDSIYIQRNLFENCGETGNTGLLAIHFQNQDAIPTAYVSNIFILNNTFIAAVSDAPIIAVGLPYYSGTNVNRNINVINNIITGFSLTPIYSGTGYLGATATINTINIKNNDYYNNSSDVPILSTTNNSYTASGSITSNPLFVGSGDYNLQSGSPCRDAGINVGLPYSGSAPDIGRYEYSSGTTTNPPVTTVRGRKKIFITH